MSAKKLCVVRLKCDSCGREREFDGITAIERTRRIARQFGWSGRGQLDYCSECTASRRVKS